MVDPFRGRAPVEPASARWKFPDPRSARGDVVAVGADLAPATLLAAYRRGIFPMPAAETPDMVWWSPQERAVLPLGGLRVSRSLRRGARTFTTTVDEAFADVVAGCADPGRPGGWITGAMAAAYLELHELGWAHSVEVWQQSRLAGGLYGVAIGGLFCGESMFHRDRDASKVALLALVRLLDDGDRRRLLDVQWLTDHLASLGAVVVGRDAYLERLHAALGAPLPDFTRVPRPRGAGSAAQP